MRADTSRSPAGRAFFIAYSLVAIAILTVLLSVVTERYSDKYKAHVHKTRKRAGLDRFVARDEERGAALDGVPTSALSPAVANMAAELGDDHDAAPPGNLGQVLLDNVRGFNEHCQCVERCPHALIGQVLSPRPRRRHSRTTARSARAAARRRRVR